MSSNRSLRWTAEKLAMFFARHPRWLIAGVLLYLISPIDLIPEAFVGPLGYLDDLVVLILPFFVREYVRHLRAPKSKTPPKDYYDTSAS